MTGTIDDVAAVLTVNGVQLTQSGGSFQASVALEEGHNAIVVRAVDTLGHEGTDSLNISLDKTPPYITIESPADGSTVSSEVVAVTGLVNDIVRGTITDQDAVVTVNGVQASVANRSYLAEGVLLAEGANAITISAPDAVGNTASITATVIYDPPVGAHIELVNGQGQGSQILTQLPNALEVIVKLHKERDKAELEEKYEHKREGREERAEKTRAEQEAQKQGLDKYLKIMDWDVPDIDEPKARQLMLDEIKLAISRLESQ